MKYILCILALFSASLNSCTGLREKNDASDVLPQTYGSGWYSEGGLPEKYLTYEKKEIVPLFPEKKDPNLEFFVNTLDISSEAESKLLQQTLYGGLNYMDYAENVYKKVNDDYQKIKETAVVQPKGPYDWSYIETFSGVIYPELLVISHSSYIYSGGAHGQNQKAYFVLDTKLLKKLTPRDILRDGTEEALQKQIDDALRAKYAKYNADSGTALKTIGFFEDTAGKSENFFVSKEGLGFCWNPYDIAPYSMGVIEVVLPYDKIENLLTERGVALFKNL
ncbi:MAG: RsiV family protein [Spirochaetaceae bacterium]|jgi:hypothetical protein|nr:RsiV family protein [Spirochaetaceae bacterium]